MLPSDRLMIAWHHEVANFQFQVICIAVFVFQSYRIMNFGREMLRFLEMTLEIWDKELSQTWAQGIFSATLKS